jgi:hypothetical protein
VDRHGPRSAWGPSLAGCTTRWWISTPPLGRFGKGEKEFLLELGLLLGLERRGGNRVGTRFPSLVDLGKGPAGLGPSCLYKGGGGEAKGTPSTLPPVPRNPSYTTATAGRRCPSRCRTSRRPSPSLHRRRLPLSLSHEALPVFYPNSIGDAEALPDLHRHILSSPCP